MLSRVMKDAAVEAQPFRPFRKLVAIPAGEVFREPKGEPPNEAAVLRAKLAQAAVETKQQLREAYESGLRAGEAAMRQELQAQVQQAVERLVAATAEIAEVRSETIRRAEADTVRLSVEIARRILHRELSIDGAALEALVKAALEKLEGKEIYRVRVHPDQEEVVKSCLAQSGRGQNVTVTADPVLPPGGAVFEINRGALDASVDTQLREIARGLTDQLEARL